MKGLYFSGKIPLLQSGVGSSILPRSTNRKGGLRRIGKAPVFFPYKMEGSPNGMVPLLKSGGRKPLEVRLLYPPQQSHCHLLPILV